MFTTYKLVAIECKYENRWKREMRVVEERMLKNSISMEANEEYEQEEGRDKGKRR